MQFVGTMRIIIRYLLSVCTFLAAENILCQNTSVFQHSIGEYFQGGVIYHLWIGDDGKEHGLIASLRNLDTNCVWGSDCSDVEEFENISYGPASLKDGALNTYRIVNLSKHKYGAPKTCYTSRENGYNDWYMPSILELVLLLENTGLINRTAEKVGQHDKIVPALYMSSSDCADGYCGYLGVKLGSSYRLDIQKEHKKISGKESFLRAIRKF